MRLILLRHAKSSWKHGLDDHARPLNRRGRGDAPRVAQALLDRGWAPDFVISSDAMRTRETWALMRGALGAQARFHRELYLATASSVLDTVAAIDGQYATAMLIGHNPGWEVAASRLGGTDLSMTTCNAALLTVQADSWSDAAAMTGCWELEELLRPRELPSQAP